MKISLSDSQKKAIIAFIKPQKRKFYKALWKWYSERAVLSTNHHTTSPIREAITCFPEKYGYISELQIIYLVLVNDMQHSGNLQTLMYMHKKYWERFHKYYVFPRTKKGVPFPHMKKTRAIAEFLARGFVHKDDAVDWRDRKYIIECTIAPLVWPEGFSQHGEAIKRAGELGINGYTKCPIPK